MLCLISQNHRALEAGRDLWRSPDPSPMFKQYHLRPVAYVYPDGFWLSPRRETPQSTWAICASAQSSLQENSISWFSDGTSCVSVCGHCLWCCHGAQLAVGDPVGQARDPRIQVGMSMSYEIGEGVTEFKKTRPVIFNCWIKGVNSWKWSKLEETNIFKCSLSALGACITNNSPS